jgi:hypothetical protein
MTQPPPFTAWSLVRRCVIAAGAGGVLALVWFGLFWLFVSETVCSSWNCLVLGVLVLPASLVVLAVLAWPLLMLFRLPRAWLAALIAPVPVLAFARIAVLTIPLGHSYTFPLAGIVAAPLGYALAALLSQPGLTPAWRIGLAVSAGLLVVVAFVLPSPSPPPPHVPVRTIVAPAEPDPPTMPSFTR